MTNTEFLICTIGGYAHDPNACGHGGANYAWVVPVVDGLCSVVYCNGGEKARYLDTDVRTSQHPFRMPNDVARVVAAAFNAVHADPRCADCNDPMPEVRPEDLLAGELPVCRDCGFGAMERKHGADWYVER